MRQRLINFSLLIVLSCTSLITTGQRGTLGGQILSYQEYMRVVGFNHPLAKQSYLLLERGNAALLGARGGFDPKVGVSYDQKLFKNDPYYRILNAAIKVPTQLGGLDVNVGYERTSGTNLNPEELNPDAGLLYAGVSLPLGRGLLIDNRRAQLRQANIFNESTAVERQAILNEVLQDAGLTYWEWWEAYSVWQIYKEAVVAAEERLEAVKQSVLGGDMPPIDSVEASIQVQNLELERIQSRIDFLNATLLLSTFLWDESANPLILDENTIPTQLQFDQSEEISQLLLENLEFVIQNHPELRLYDFKLQELEIDNQLAREFLKPQVDLKWNFIVDGGNNPITAISPNNHTMSVVFGMPIFFRKERAKIQQTEIKIQETSFDQLNKRADLSYKLGKALNDWETSIEQYLNYNDIVANYSIMLEGERTLFDNGESSLFLINSRQQKFINAQIKQTQLLAKNRMAEVKTLFAAGTLANQL